MASDGDTGGFDLARGSIAIAEGLETEITKTEGAARIAMPRRCPFCCFLYLTRLVLTFNHLLFLKPQGVLRLRRRP